MITVTRDDLPRLRAAVELLLGKLPESAHLTLTVFLPADAEQRPAYDALAADAETRLFLGALSFRSIEIREGQYGQDTIHVHAPIPAAEEVALKAQHGDSVIVAEQRG